MGRLESGQYGKSAGSERFKRVGATNSLQLTAATNACVPVPEGCAAVADRCVYCYVRPGAVGAVVPSLRDPRPSGPAANPRAAASLAAVRCDVAPRQRTTRT